MLIIGLTGGIGSGKSTVATIFSKLNVPIYDSDTRAKTLLNTNQELITKVKDLFGKDIYDQDNHIKREELAKLVFNNATKLQQLNAIVHPAVKEDTKIWQELHKDNKYVIKESAILFETGIYKDMYKNILVIAPLELRIQRVMHRDNATKEQVEARINKQMRDEEKMNLADYIIINDESISLVEQVLIIHRNILSL